MAVPAAIAWDIDGTLVDSEPLHLQALLEVCRAYAVDISDFGSAPFAGVAIDEVWRQLGARFGAALGTEPARRSEAFRCAIGEHYLARVGTLRAMPGALQTLQWMSERDVPMCAVSNSDAQIVEANLRAIGVRELFGFTVTLDDVNHPKPHPEPYCRALTGLGMPAQHVVAVEDSATGLQSAQAAGLGVLLVLSGEATAPWHAAARHRMHSLHALAPWWQQQQISTPLEHT